MIKVFMKKVVFRAKNLYMVQYGLFWGILR